MLHRIGKGGMGVVYAAYDPQLDRKVALKVLRPELASDSSRTRLLREAQAMARVSHPNVMRVLDVGTVDDLVFMAMELVDGVTLGGFLESTKPPWRESLRLFIAAGRGLAAAHAVGLVHRDFKPDNVLVAQDGAVQVIDFGLARAESDGSREIELPAEIRESSGPTALESQLTHAGAVMGTPLYMSPEQLAGQHADARSDQFSFCVAAWQALYGALPFRAATMDELRAATASGKIVEPPRSPRVPAWVRRALMRGLAASPAQRWPSMDALLAELGREPMLRRRLAAAIALGLVGLGALTWPLSRARAREKCAVAGSEISGTWNDEAKSKLHDTFKATGAPFAEDAWSTSVRRLDSYVGEWKAVRTEACEAATVLATQNEEQLALRVGCLDQRKQELAALVDVLARADTQVAQEAVSAVHALTSLAGCSDVVALRAAKPPATDAAAKARIEQARAVLASAKSLADLGRISAALERAHEAIGLARETRFAPLIAEALTREGELQGKMGDRKSAEATLQEAVSFAQAGNADELAARAWNRLGFVVGYELGRQVEGKMFCRYAAAVIGRLGNNPQLAADNLRSTGLVLENEGKFDEALKVLNEALAISEQLYGAEHPAVATMATSVGNAHIMKAEFALALPFHQRALAIRLKLLGPLHPDASKSYHNLAICLSHLGQRPQAIAYLEKALAVDSGVFGPHSDQTALTRHTLAKAWFETHQPGKAREALLPAIEDLVHAFGPDAPALCPPLQLLGRIELTEGHAAEALGHFQKALAIREKQMGPKVQILTGYLAGVGESELALHQPRLALAAFERVAALEHKKPLPPEDLADIAWGLARATWDSGGDRSAAVAHAVEAKQFYSAAIDRGEEVVAVDAWLASHAR